jgi:hypothetical protein
MRVIDQSTCVCNELRITMGYIHSLPFPCDYVNRAVAPDDGFAE